MEVLCDDIMIRILSYLDLKSQKVMIDLHPRFYDLMSIVWSQYKTIIVSLFEAQFSMEDWNYFVQSVRRTVEVLRLRMMSIAEFEILVSNVFPKVHDFRFATIGFQQKLSDEAIPKIVHSFPVLKTFSPHGNFSGLHFDEFPLLERLTLSYCSGFALENLNNIMRTHQLKELNLCLFGGNIFQSNVMQWPVEYMKSLQAIKVETDELLSIFGPHLSQLYNMKELIVCGSYVGTFHYLCQKLWRSSHRFNVIEAGNCIEDVLHAVVGSKLHVDVLKIVAYNYLLETLNFNTQTFENIKQMFFKNCTILKRNSFDCLMHSIPNVELLSFEQCKFDFDDYTFVASEIAENRNRNKPLLVNLFENKLSKTELPWNWRMEGENALLQFVEGRNYEYSYEYIRLSFK